MNKTAVTAHITPFPNTTITNYETNVAPTNAIFSTGVDAGFDPLPSYSNDAPGPEFAVTMYNTSQLVIGDQTLYVNEGFWGARYLCNLDIRQPLLILLTLRKS